ncbi:MAG: hypothetical protein ABEH78_00645 [Haloferacaceae archaeon]
MLSGKLPTGTVGADERPDRLDPDRDAVTRRPDGRGQGGKTRGESERASGARVGTERTPRTGDGRERAGATGDTDCRADAAGRADRLVALERQVAVERAERRAVVDRYERLLAERAASGERGGNENGGGLRIGSVGVGRVRAWVRRACCRVRLRLSRRG